MSPTLLLRLNFDQEQVDYVRTFTNVYSFGLIALTERALYETWLFLLKKNKLAMAIALGSFALSVSVGAGLAWLYGAPALAAAFTAETVLTAVLMLGVLLLHKETKQLALFSCRHYDRSLFRRQMGVINRETWPKLLSTLFEVAVPWLLTYFANQCGDDALNELNNGFQYYFVTTIVAGAAGIVLGIQVGDAIGKEQYGLAITQAKRALLTSALIALMLTAGIAPISFVSSKAYTSMRSSCNLSLFLLGIGLDKSRYVMVEISQRTKDAWVARAISFLLMGSLLTAGGVVATHTPAGFTAVPVSYLAAQVCTVGALSLRLKSRLKVVLLENACNPQKKLSQSRCSLSSRGGDASPSQSLGTCNAMQNVLDMRGSLEKSLLSNGNPQEFPQAAAP